MNKYYYLNFSLFLKIPSDYEKKYLIYNDGTISKNKLWIGLSHIKEKKSLGYFGYVYNNNFYVVDKKFKVSNGPAIDKKNNKKYFLQGASQQN